MRSIRYPHRLGERTVHAQRQRQRRVHCGIRLPGTSDVLLLLKFSNLATMHLDAQCECILHPLQALCQRSSALRMTVSACYEQCLQTWRQTLVYPPPRGHNASGSFCRCRRVKRATGACVVTGLRSYIVTGARVLSNIRSQLLMHFTGLRNLGGQSLLFSGLPAKLISWQRPISNQRSNKA